MRVSDRVMLERHKVLKPTMPEGVTIGQVKQLVCVWYEMEGSPRNKRRAISRSTGIGAEVIKVIIDYDVELSAWLRRLKELEQAVEMLDKIEEARNEHS